ncbi:FAD-dependent monooxygenase [Rhodoplanes sp. TEM]|uniref:FAD-dependent monooxygenase n=1 Tax=Rhodoplanes tepidamans TaxID=200616 RepID=A0ABT5J601_RHOTP|nr:MULTISPECIES: FAD-dependent monooxygenase [Rhodoplanes]MDC7785082.1 FAD-dependent monooxygenase [Rhodoplanes tepidamans]MDC7982556.1 FAD-dependent monooxygenase [Rhodoplanes sp. TEM]MDQ0356572.1 3-(3-hydroxy-phenyl)propionate hydroxylase [Rhodoplanes tepidamans]
MSSGDTSRTVLIAGGGPVGLLCAWLIGRQGIPVRLFDLNDGPQADPRAATTHPATLDLLADDGLSADMARVGLVARTFQFWDRPGNEKVCEFDHAILADATRHPFVVQCEQFKTAKLILDRIARLPNVEVLYRHEVLTATQSASEATVEVRGPDGTVARHSGAWLIGADGGRSVVRKQAEIPFEGFTWPERFIVLTTPFDFEAQRGLCFRSYWADPDEWCNCFKVSHDGPPGLWRCVFPTDPNVAEAELMSDAAVQARMQKFFPADRPYEIVHRNLYVTHQRVATTFRKGRVLLAGDAAHVNNPIGGMGLNGGLQDGANLAEKLLAVTNDGAPEALLDLYDLQRRTVAIEFVQEQTIANKKRLEARDAETRRKNLDELRAIAGDPDRARQFLMRTSMIASQARAAAMTLEPA